MKLRLMLCVMCTLLLAAFVTVRAEDKAADASKKDMSKGKLTQPWNKMSDLSDDQKAKIKEIHAKANDDVKAIREKENTDILALLSDAQKDEAKKLMDEAKASGKKPKAEAAATEEPKKEEPAK